MRTIITTARTAPGETEHNPLDVACLSLAYDDLRVEQTLRALLRDLREGRGHSHFHEEAMRITLTMATRPCLDTEGRVRPGSLVDSATIWIDAEVVDKVDDLRRLPNAVTIKFTTHDRPSRTQRWFIARVHAGCTRPMFGYHEVLLDMILDEIVQIGLRHFEVEYGAAIA